MKKNTPRYRLSLRYADPSPPKTRAVWSLLVCGRCDTLPKLRVTLRYFAYEPGQLRHLLRLCPSLASRNPVELFAAAAELAGLLARPWGRRGKIRFERSWCRDADRRTRIDYACELGLRCLELCHGIKPELELDNIPGYAHILHSSI